MTHDTLTSAINGILGFRGQRIGFPDGRYYNECTAIVAHLHQRLGIPLPSMYGARADGWGVSFPGELAPYYSHEAYQPGKAYPYGTLLLWNSPHIAVVLSHDGGNMVQVFQQNADPNGAPCEVFNRVINNQFHSCNYALIPKLEAPAPAAPPAPLFTVEGISPKQIKVNPGARKWNLGYGNFNDVAANPITTADGNTIFTAVAVLHHRAIPQYNYYLEDPNTPHGWNVLDCSDYTPPPPPPVIPSPSLSAPASAPVPVPKAEMYDVITTIVYYPTAKDATIDQNAIGTLEPRSYYVYSRDGKMLNLTTSNQHDQGKWINPAMNKIEPPKVIEPVIEVKPVEAVPVITPTVITEVAAPTEPPKQEADMATDWKQCTPIKVNPNTGQWVPVKYRSTNDIMVNIRSLDGKQPATVQLSPRHELNIVSTFIGPDGIKYARDDLLTVRHRFYALRFDMLEKVVPPPVIRTMDVNHDGDVNISDFIDFGNKYFKPGLAIATRTVQTVKKSKFVDGIVAGATKKRNKVQ